MLLLDSAPFIAILLCGPSMNCCIILQEVIMIETVSYLIMLPRTDSVLNYWHELVTNVYMLLVIRRCVNLLPSNWPQQIGL